MKAKIRTEIPCRSYLQLSVQAQTNAGAQRGSAMALIDWQRVEDLAAEIGADAVVEVVAMFLEETDGVIASMGACAPTTDDYHFLKGSALNLGLGDLAALCQVGEQETKGGLVNPLTLSAVMAIYPASKDALLDGIAARFGG